MPEKAIDMEIAKDEVRERVLPRNFAWVDQFSECQHLNSPRKVDRGLTVLGNVHMPPG
jgi:hypothetical protein